MDWIKGTFKRKTIAGKLIKMEPINYELFTEDKTAMHFKQKMEKIRSLLNSWIY